MFCFFLCHLGNVCLSKLMRFLPENFIFINKLKLKGSILRSGFGKDLLK